MEVGGAVDTAIKIRNSQFSAELAEELENRCTGNRTGGSTPSPSARKFTRLIFFVKKLSRFTLAARSISEKFHPAIQRMPAEVLAACSSRWGHTTRPALRWAILKPAKSGCPAHLPAPEFRRHDQTAPASGWWRRKPRPRWDALHCRQGG